MIRRLIILLLIVGCGNIFPNEGICVLKDMEDNLYTCYPDTPESQCIADSLIPHATNTKAVVLKVGIPGHI